MNSVNVGYVMYIEYARADAIGELQLKRSLVIYQ